MGTEDSLVGSMVRFMSALRTEGLVLTPDDAADSVRALGLVDVASAQDVYHALRSLTVVRPDQFDIFDRVFRRFFGNGAPAESPLDPSAALGHEHEWVARHLSGSSDADASDVAEQVGASLVERMGSRDFSSLDDVEVEVAKRLIARMVWQPAETRSRRWKADARGLRPDLRATLRSMVGPRADLVPLEMTGRRNRRRPLVVIADVSGSMEAYAEMVLTFAHAARSRVGRVETFVFSTRLTRVTWQLSRRDLRAALKGTADAVDDWSGGTQIGAALETFNRDWSRRVLRGGPVLMIVSDGWDCGDIALLDREMARLARSVHRVVWLNPLSGRSGYAPETRGIKTVLPYVDDFLPAATVLDLAHVIELLESTVKRTRAA